MKAFFVTKHADVTNINWLNTAFLSRNLEKALKMQKELKPEGVVVEVEMDDDDVVEAVLAAMHDSSCEVRIKVLRVVGPHLVR